MPTLSRDIVRDMLENQLATAATSTFPFVGLRPATGGVDEGETQTNARTGYFQLQRMQLRRHPMSKSGDTPTADLIATVLVYKDGLDSEQAASTTDDLDVRVQALVAACTLIALRNTPTGGASQHTIDMRGEIVEDEVAAQSSDGVLNGAVAIEIRATVKAE